MPFYFQATKGVSAESSGIKFLALAVPQVVATIVAGGFTTKTGHYVRYPSASWYHYDLQV